MRGIEKDPERQRDQLTRNYERVATHSSVLAWRIPGMGEPGGLPSLGSHRVRHDESDLAAAAASLCFILNLKRTLS